MKLKSIMLICVSVFIFFFALTVLFYPEKEEEKEDVKGANELLKHVENYREVEGIFIKNKNKNISISLDEIEKAGFIIESQQMKKSKKFIYYTYKFKNFNITVKCKLKNVKVLEVVD